MINNLLQSISNINQDTIALKWRVKAIIDSVELFSVREMVFYILIVNTVGLNQLELKEIKLFPNPASDKCYIQSSEKINKLNIFDCNGRLIIKQEEIINNEINLTNLTQGIYLIQVFTAKGNGFVKLMKNDY